MVQGRPRKTQDELDAEMTDYFKDIGESNQGGGREESFGGDAADDIEQPNASAPAGGAAPVDEDVDMIE